MLKGNVPMKPGAEANDHYGWAVASAGDFDGDGDWDLAVGAPEGNKLNDAVTGFIHLQDSSAEVVPSFFSFWTASWAGTGVTDIVRLSFSFALPADQFADVQLSRQVRDSQGGLLDEATIWAGQAQWGQGEVPGVLSISGDGFTFLDQIPVDAFANAVSLSYSLNAGDGSVPRRARREHQRSDHGSARPSGERTLPGSGHRRLAAHDLERTDRFGRRGGFRSVSHSPGEWEKGP